MKKIVRAIAPAFLSAAVVVSCGGNAEEVSPDAVVPTIVVQQTDVAVAQYSTVAGGVVLTGTLNPQQIAEVRSQVPGIVGRFAADRGDPVKAGQLITTIEAEGIRSAAAGAQAQVSAAEANVALARQRLESSRKLYERGAISQIDFQSAEAAFEAAQGQLAAAQAQAAAASESARRASITAPFAGEISRRHVNPGEAVNPGDPIATVVNTSQLELAGQVPVQYAAGVRRGQRVEFTVDAYPGQKFEGVVNRVEPTADPATRQVGVYLRLPNPGGRLVGGVFATGRVLSAVADSALAIPTSAIRTESGSTYVWLIQQDIVTRRPVVTGAQDDVTGMTAILSGLAVGDRVLAVPGEVTEGTIVRFSGPGVTPPEETRP